MITPDSSFNIRLNAIKQQHCPREIFINIYGLDLWKDASEVAGRFTTWSANSQNKTIVFNDETVDRWAFESFLQQEHVLPLKTAAIRFAMNEEDFSDLLGRMCEQNMLSRSIKVDLEGKLLSLPVLNDLDKHFKSLRMRFFTSQASFIEAFHKTIQEQLGLQINSIYSKCSQELKDNPIDMATEFDILTGEPLGNAHQVWLDFGKPLALRPDTCSIVTYVRHQQSLKEFCPYPLEEQELEKTINLLEQS